MKKITSALNYISVSTLIINNYSQHCTCILDTCTRYRSMLLIELIAVIIIGDLVVANANNK